MTQYTVTETYETITPESAEHGEAEDSGLLYEGAMDAREIAEYMSSNGFTLPSSSHYHSGIWFSTEGDIDYRTGDTEIRSLHFTQTMDRRLVRAICNYAGVRVIF